MGKQIFSEVRIEKKMWHKVADIFGLVAIILGLMLLVTYWPQLSETVPIHFNAKGEADGWGSKYTLIILPIVVIALFSLLSFLEKRPQSYNYVVKITEQNAQRQYILARGLLNYTKNVATCLLMYVACYSIVQANMSNVIFIVMLVLLLGGIAIYIIQSIKHK